MKERLVKEDLGGRLRGKVTIYTRAVMHFGRMGGSVGAEMIGKEVEGGRRKLVRTTLHRTLHKMLQDGW